MSAATVVIRSARPADVPALPTIETAAGQSFAEIGMAEIASDPVPVAEYYAKYQQAGRAWVGVNPRDEPIAYLLLDVIDGSGHIEQASVRSTYARRGIGQALINHAASWAAVNGLRALTLFTFADVPWNAPLYRRCGFEILPESQLTPGLSEIQRRESERGLDRWPRVGMIRNLTPS